MERLYKPSMERLYKTNHPPNHCGIPHFPGQQPK